MTMTFHYSQRRLSLQLPTTQRKLTPRLQVVAATLLTFDFISKAFPSEFQDRAAPKQA
jgi:hypothetical protein